MFNRIANHAGHGKQDSKSCGTVGLVKESIVNRLISKESELLFKKEGKTVIDCTIDYPSSKNDCLNKIVQKTNACNPDLSISHHINDGRNDTKGDGSIGGVEVWVSSRKSNAYDAAVRVCRELEKLGFKNRGVKFNPQYAVIGKIKAPAMIIEYFFDDDKDDCDLYNKLGYKSLAKAVVQGILNKQITSSSVSDNVNNHVNGSKKYKNCIIYSGEIDKAIATCMSFYLEDCIVKDVKEHIKWEGLNLFVVGGACNTFKSEEKFTKIFGSNRKTTHEEMLKFIKK